MKTRIVAAVVVVALLASGTVTTLVLLSGGNGVELPDEVDGLPARDAAAAVPADNERRDDILKDQRETRERIAARYAEAYDGADADVRFYGDLTDDDAPVYTVLAIELDAGPLLPDGLDDPEYTGYAVPQIEVVHEGDAVCVLRRTQPPLADSEYDESDIAPDVVTCQRSSGSLSVRVVSSHDPTVEDTTAFLDAVWSELS